MADEEIPEHECSADNAEVKTWDDGVHVFKEFTCNVCGQKWATSELATSNLLQ